MAELVAFDAIDYRLNYPYTFTRDGIETSRRKMVKVSLGLGIEIDKPDELVAKYDKAIDDVFSKHDRHRVRRAYCASSLAKFFGDETFGHESQVIDTITSEIKPAIARFHFFYTYLFRIPTVSVFGNSTSFKRIPAISHEEGEQDFYDLINPSYTFLCAWKFLQDYNANELLLDNFQGHVSPAWNEFFSKGKGKVYYSGDECNHFISATDIFLRKIKIELTKRLLRSLRNWEHHQIHFTEDGIKDFTKVALGNNVAHHFLGTMYLNKIAPHETKTMATNHLVKHPVFYIVRESPREEDEKAIIEISPVYSKILNMALEADGCVKFYHPSADPEVMQPNDVIVTFGPRGGQIFDTLERNGIRGLKHLKTAELLKDSPQGDASKEVPC